MNDRETRATALNAAITICGSSRAGNVLEIADQYYNWLIQSSPLPPPAFGFVNAAAQMTASDENEKKSAVVTVEQACQILGLSEPTMRRRAADDEDFPRKIQLSKRRVGYLRADLESYLSLIGENK